MRLAPVFGDVLSRTKPDPVVLAHVLEKFDQPDRARRPADQPIMQADAHDFGPVNAFLIEHVETVDHVAREIAGGAEAVRVVTVVVRLIGIGGDNVWPAPYPAPLRHPL